MNLALIIFRAAFILLGATLIITFILRWLGLDEKEAFNIASWITVISFIIIFKEVQE